MTETFRNLALGAMICIAPAIGHAASTGWNTLSGEAPIVIGHRGAPAYLPENSLPGYELAADMGSQVVETDVMLSSDGELIVMHDTTLNRTTNIEELYAPRNGGYAVEDFTLAEIKNLSLDPEGVADYDYPGFNPTTTYEVPTLGELLDTLNAYNVTNGTDVGILTELKGSYTPEANTKVVELMIEKGFGTDKTTDQVQSFNRENVVEMSQLIDEAGADMFVALLGGGGVLNEEGEWGFSHNGGVELLGDLAMYADAAASYYTGVSEAFIDAAHAQGLAVYAWTFRPGDLDDAATMMADFLDWGLDGFITDNPDLAGAVIAEYGGNISAVPLPATLPMLAFGALALGGLARRKARRAA